MNPPDNPQSPGALSRAAHLFDTRPGGPSAKTFHRAGSANRQIASKENSHV